MQVVYVFACVCLYACVWYIYVRVYMYVFMLVACSVKGNMFPFSYKALPLARNHKATPLSHPVSSSHFDTGTTARNNWN